MAWTDDMAVRLARGTSVPMLVDHIDDARPPADAAGAAEPVRHELASGAPMTRPASCGA